MINKKILVMCLLIFLINLPLEVWAETNRHDETPEAINKLRKQRLSQITIYDNYQEKVQVFLFAEDEKVEILEGSYCGGEEGDKQYTGNYQFISVKDDKIVSKIDLGKDYEFVENTLYNGLHRFITSNLDNLIAIYQYRSCNTEKVEFYRIDAKGYIDKINFFDKDGTVRTDQTTGPNGDILRTNGNLTFCNYNNAVGYIFCDSYYYNEKGFSQAAGWMTQELSKQEKTVDGEARRILFEYLSALSEKDYKGAVFYYAGSYDLLMKLNPDVSSNDEPILFERYCSKNGRKCFLSEYPDFIDIKSSVELKAGTWEVSFKSTTKPDFAFRIRRIGNEFKIMDLPPTVP